MKTLTFQGHSDDTFACTGPRIDVDHDNCANDKPVTMLVSGEGGRLLVIGQYAAGHSGGWQIAVAPYDPEFLDDDTVAIPRWTMTIEPGDRPYSPVLVIVAPEDVSVELLDELTDEED